MFAICARNVSGIIYAKQSKTVKYYYGPGLFGVIQKSDGSWVEGVAEPYCSA